MYNHEYAKELERANKYDELFQYVIKYEDGQDPRALNMIARCFYYGYGTEKDYSKCFLYDKKAADMNDGDAVATLGWDYEKGVGVEANIEFAIELYQKAVDKDSNKGYCYLGLCYERGIGVEKNEQKAAKYYSVASERKNAMAQRFLGRCYEYGIGVEQDEQKAFELYCEAAQEGGAISQRYLARCYELGIGIECNSELAIHWYTMSANQGDKTSQEKLGGIFFYSKERDNYKKALPWFEKLAKHGDLISTLHLAMCYAQISTSKDDLSQIFNCYVQAVNLENTNDFFYSIACYEVARYYENGWGVKENFQKAFEFYLKSAELNYVEAQVKVAGMLVEGVGTCKDENLAVYWYKKAAFQNNALALARLSNYYEKGLIVPQNTLQAINGFKKALTLFDDVFNQALCLEHIADCIKQLEEAGAHFEESSKTYYEKSLEKYLELADEGDGEAHLRVANFLEFGKGVTGSNMLEAFEHYETAARILNSGYSYFVLAKCYEFGIGVARNYKKAFELYKKAGVEGHSVAKVYVGYCYERGIGVKKSYARAISIYNDCLTKDEDAVNLANLYLGLCYYHGVGVKSDLGKAKQFFKNSSTVGGWYIDIIEGRYNSITYLATLYSCQNIASDYNLIIDFRRVALFLTMAKEHGVITMDQALELEECYRTGKGVERNKKTAFNIITDPLFENAGNVTALRRIGQYYFYGYGTSKDRCKALRFFERAMYKGDAISKVYVSLYYANGYGVEQNYHKAVDILKSEETNNNYATVLLGLLMLAGEWGFEEKRTEAMVLLGRVADEGSPYITQELFDWLQGIQSKSFYNLLVKIFISRMHYQTFDPSVKWKYLIRYLPALSIKLIAFSKSNSKETTISMLFAENQELNIENQKLKGEMVALRGELEKLEHFRTISERIERVELTLQKGFNDLGNKMDEGFDKISVQIASLKAFVEDSLQSMIVQERISFKQELIDKEKTQEELLFQLSQKINQALSEKTKDMNELLEEEESYLKGLFGDIWGKLHSDTKSSLKSARVLWKSCASINNPTFDYSGICISLTAALEMELKRVFFFAFQRYMQRTYGKPNVKPLEWPQDLIYTSRNGNIGFSNGKNITLGSISHLLSTTPNTLLSEKMEEYLSTIMKKRTNNILDIFNDGGENSFVSVCDQITRDYRNPAAHTGIIARGTVIECYNKIVGKMEASETIGQTTSLLLKLYEYVDIEKVSRYL